VKTLCHISACLLLLTSAGVCTDLGDVRRGYEAEVRRIRDEHEANLERLLDVYARSLDSSIGMLRRKGDPDPVLVALAEKTRFGKTRTVPARPPGNLPTQLKQRQAGYHKAVKRAELEKVKRFVDTTEKYMAALGQLMAQYTAEDKLGLALDVKQEGKRGASVLADVDSNPELMDAETGEGEDLLARIDPSRDTVQYRWLFVNEGLYGMYDSRARITVPVVPRGDYHLRLVVRRLEKNEAFRMMLPVGTSAVVLEFDGWPRERGIGGLTLLRGVKANKNATSVRGFQLTRDVDTTIDVTVKTSGKGAKIEARANGRKVVDWSGAQGDLSLQAADHMPYPEALGFGTHEKRVLIKSAKLRMLRGKAEPLYNSRRPQPPRRLQDDCWTERWSVTATAPDKPFGFFIVHNPNAETDPDPYRAGYVTLHPRGRTQPARLARRLTLPAGSPRLHVGLRAFDADVRLGVTVDGQAVAKPTIIRNERRTFSDLVYDLSAFAGRRATIEVICGRDQPSPAYALFDYVQLVEALSETSRRLATLDPVGARTAHWRLHVDRHPSGTETPVIAGRKCEHYLLAHAPSVVFYTIPDGARYFTTTGYCMRSKSVTFVVYADGKPLATSSDPIAPLACEIPPGARLLKLQVRSNGKATNDHSFWCDPTWHGAAPAGPSKAWSTK